MPEFARRVLRGLAAAVLVALILGCKTGQLPDPNDPAQAGDDQPEVLRKNLKSASDTLMERRAKLEITDEQYKQLMTRYALELLSRVDIESIDPQKAWEYADVCRAAKQWQRAEAILRIAVKAAKDEDRRVNDSLHLAEALGYLGKPKEAIAVARSVFNTPPREKAPILTGVLLEIVPATRGKGQDVELAKLLEDAIHQAEETVVDQSSDAGRTYLIARPHHVRNAWRTIEELYYAAGKPELAREARDRSYSSGEGLVRT